MSELSSAVVSGLNGSAPTVVRHADDLRIGPVRLRRAPEASPA